MVTVKEDTYGEEQVLLIEDPTLHNLVHKTTTDGNEEQLQQLYPTANANQQMQDQLVAAAAVKNDGIMHLESHSTLHQQLSPDDHMTINN